MYIQYDYLNSILPNFREIGTIARVSGLSGMEEVMEKIRQVKSLVLIVEDDSDGFLDLSRGNFDNSFQSFSVFGISKLGDSSDRNRVLNLCFQTGLKILNQMLADSRDFGDPVYGFDRTRVSYMRIGPLVNNSYGYTFSYTMQNEKFILV
jgi:hypothetical protein